MESRPSITRVVTLKWTRLDRWNSSYVSHSAIPRTETQTGECVCIQCSTTVTLTLHGIDAPSTDGESGHRFEVCKVPMKDSFEKTVRNYSPQRVCALRSFLAEPSVALSVFFFTANNLSLFYFLDHNSATCTMLFGSVIFPLFPRGGATVCVVLFCCIRKIGRLFAR